MLIDASASLDAGDRLSRWRAAARLEISHQILCDCAGLPLADDDALPAMNERRRAAVRGHHGTRSWCFALDARHGPRALETIATEPQLAGVDLVTHDADRAALSDIVEAADARTLPLRLSDASVAATLARAHPRARFVLSNPDGSSASSLPLDPLAELPNIYLDLASCAAVRGALDQALARLGATRLLWGTGRRMEVARAQLAALDVIAPGADAIEAIRWGNALRLFGVAGSPR